jgi:hypothetical protein
MEDEETTTSHLENFLKEKKENSETEKYLGKSSSFGSVLHHISRFTPQQMDSRLYSGDRCGVAFFPFVEHFPLALPLLAGLSRKVAVCN